MVNLKRVKTVKNGVRGTGPVLYWMSRDQRVSDNWALLYALEIAEDYNQPLLVVFNITNRFLGATWRQYDFMLNGLKRTEKRFRELNIPFTVLIGEPETTLPNFIRLNKTGHLVMDFDPLRIKRAWQSRISALVNIPTDIVDAHNTIPCFVASEKEEFSAATFRFKVRKLLPEFMDTFPPIVKQYGKSSSQQINWAAVTKALKVDHSVRAIDWIVPGEKGAWNTLEKFISEKARTYAAKRNDPNEKSVSGLSPYLHFGHISAQRVALEINARLKKDEHTEAFLEELIVRRELADNFCYYNDNYDSMSGFRKWAVDSLNEHRGDEREYLYTTDQLEYAATHDSLWNAAQNQMVYGGTMPGYMRMYWAKKILEWSDSPEEAMKIAIYLNDKYQLDGRDPCGYTGCAWSVGGIHDRPWRSRNIYGKIRYMNRAGCERKFDVDRYIVAIDQIKK
jgi:deoxyribodipyrimidine photo-lyase